MATKQSTKPTQAAAASADAAERADVRRIQLVGIHAAVRMAVSVLRVRPCGDKELATVLIRMALQPLEVLLQEATHV